MFTLVVHSAEFIKTRPIQDEWNRSVGRPTNYVISSHKTYFTLLLLNSFLLQTPLFVFYKFWIMQVVSLALILYNLEKNPEFPRFPCLCEKEIHWWRAWRSRYGQQRKAELRRYPLIHYTTIFTFSITFILNVCFIRLRKTKYILAHGLKQTIRFID